MVDFKWSGERHVFLLEVMVLRKVLKINRKSVEDSIYGSHFERPEQKERSIRYLVLVVFKLVFLA